MDLSFHNSRREAVRAAMAHAWRGYVRYAWGNDELMPVSQIGKNSFGGLGATIVDALDTLWLMDMQSEYQAARDWVANKLRFDVYVSSHSDSGCM